MKPWCVCQSGSKRWCDHPDPPGDAHDWPLSHPCSLAHFSPGITWQWLYDRHCARELNPTQLHWRLCRGKSRYCFSFRRTVAELPLRPPPPHTEGSSDPGWGWWEGWRGRLSLLFIPCSTFSWPEDEGFPFLSPANWNSHHWGTESSSKHQTTDGLPFFLEVLEFFRKC